MIVGRQAGIETLEPIEDRPPGRSLRGRLGVGRFTAKCLDDGGGDQAVRVGSIGGAGKTLKARRDDSGAGAEALGEHVEKGGLAHAALADEQDRLAATAG